MSDQARIKLAKAMFPDHEFKRNVFKEPIMAAAGRWDKGLAIRAVPDPFTDANDDYAALEWVRVQRGRSGWIHFKNALAESGSAFACNYKIGDYARAALKVLEAA